MCSWSVLQENKNKKCSQMDFLPSFLPWMLKAELSLTLLHKTAAASCCCCGHCRPWLNLLLLNNKTIPFPSLTRPDRSSHKWVPWRSSHSVCGVRGCCWNKSASFCIRIFGIHCLHQKQAVCSLSEIDGFKQLVKKRNSPLSVSVCGALEKAQAQTQAQALSLTPISTMEKTASPVVVVVVHAHTLSSKQDCVELRKLAAPFIHSLLDFLGALLLSNSPQNVRPKVRGDDEEKRRRRRRKSHTHTHTHKHTQGTRGGDNGSTDNQTRGNQSD
jgi:hypothetical protein